MVITIRRGTNKEQVESYLSFETFTYNVIRTFRYNNILYRIRCYNFNFHLIILNRTETSNSGILATIKFK